MARHLTRSLHAAVSLLAHTPAEVDLDARNGQRCPVISGGLVAGEALLAGAPCYIKASDGKVYMTNGTANTEPSRTHGFTVQARAAGQTVSLYGIGARMRYAASGLTPGAPYYAGATAGRLDTAATTGGTVVIAVAVSATDIMVVGGKYA